MGIGKWEIIDLCNYGPSVTSKNRVQNGSKICKVLGVPTDRYLRSRVKKLDSRPPENGNRSERNWRREVEGF